MPSSVANLSLAAAVTRRAVLWLWLVTLVLLLPGSALARTSRSLPDEEAAAQDKRAPPPEPDPLVYRKDELSTRTIDELLAWINGTVDDLRADPKTAAAGPDAAAAAAAALRGRTRSAPSSSSHRGLDQDVTSFINSGVYYWFEKGKGSEVVTGCETCPVVSTVSFALFYPPYTFTVPANNCVRLILTESTGKNIQYEVLDFGAVVGYTSAPTTLDCRILNNLGPCCTYGEFIFQAGSHSLEMRGLSGLYDFGAIRFDTVPCPSAPTPTLTTRRPTPAPVPVPTTAVPTRSGTGSGTFTGTSLTRGLWYTFASYSGRMFVVGCGPDTPLPYPTCVSIPGVTASASQLPSPWTYASTTCTRLVVTDLWYQDNYYFIYDNGVKVGTTNSSYGDRSFGGGPNCGDNPLVCMSTGKASWGEVLLSAGTHSISIYSVLQRDRGAFMVQTVDCPPTKSPTTAPTKRPTKPPTPLPTKNPTQAPTTIPTKLPTAPPTQFPTKAPVTKAPTPSCPTLGNATRFSIWNGNTNRVAVASVVAGRSYCLSKNWTLRAQTNHEKAACGPVKISFISAPVGGRRTTLRAYSDPKPKFFLFGDNAAAPLDVFGNAQQARPLVLVKGRRYCVRSKDPYANGFTEVCFIQSC